LIEVKAKEARMGQGNPDVAIDNIKIAAEKFKLPFSTAGEKGKKAYETLLHMIQVVLDSEKDKSIKEDAIFNILAYGTPKIEVVNEVISSFKEWLSKKDILKLVRDESYAFKVDDSTTFSDIYNIIVDHFIVSKLESDYFYGSVGLTVN
jgi:hypothetical protein